MSTGLSPFMGYVGFVRVKAGTATPFVVRVTSADLNLTQEITTPDVIDSRWDRTVYQMGPRYVEGTLAFPGVYSVGSSGTSALDSANLMKLLYTRAIKRKGIYKFVLPCFDADVKYTYGDVFTYKYCIENTWKFSVTQQEPVSMEVGLMGLDRIVPDTPASKWTVLNAQQSQYWYNTHGGYVDGNYSDTNAKDADNGDTPVTRIITWNDARVTVYIEGGLTLTTEDTPSRIRHFECSINNNCDRYYTLGPSSYTTLSPLSPKFVYPKKRDVSGSLEILGRHNDLADRAYSNDSRCTERSYIEFGYTISNASSGGGNFIVHLPNIVFRIEEMTLTNDVFVTTVNYMSLPVAGANMSGENELGLMPYLDPLDQFSFTDDVLNYDVIS